MIFNELFANKELFTVPQALSKRSDYAGLVDWGLAFGGLFTGAEKRNLRIGEKLKAADSVSDHYHFHGDFDQDRQ
ncbi:hypothetical protein VSAK1_10193 [Vibrio mediterranei AK1]|nr:hypothetical protein VSAK1_10193 [Vibrio mediterranei AK1]